MTYKTLQRRALGLVLLLAACDTGNVLGPQGGAADSFVQQLDMGGLQQTVQSSAVQVEVELLPGGLTARRVAIRDDAQSAGERIQSRIVGVAPSDTDGQVTLALGGLVVTFDAQTRFWISGSEVTRAHFFDEVQGALGLGMEPPVVAERQAPDQAQAPDDAEFVAGSVGLTGEGSPGIRMNVDSANFEWADAPTGDEPDGWLNVLGLHIQLRVRDGTTDLESLHHDFDEVEHFEDQVTSVSVDAGTFTLTSGTTVRVVDRTEIVGGDGLLSSLHAVADALNAGSTVLAWGSGGVEGTGPLRLVALEVAFKVHDANAPVTKEFEGVVTAVHPDVGTLLLADGTVVQVGDGTEIVAADDASPAGLAGVAEALAAGRTVVAWGSGTVEGEDPLTLAAARIVFKLRPADTDTRHEFASVVTSVDLEAGTFTLDGGTVVRMLDTTEVLAGNDHSPHTLAGVAEALAAGHMVKASGAGEVESTEPLQLAATRVVFLTPIEDFDLPVVSVDLEAGTFTLDGGWIVRITDATAVAAADDASPSSLAGVKDALDGGRSVSARGWGFVEALEPIRLGAVSVTFQSHVGG